MRNKKNCWSSWHHWPNKKQSTEEEKCISCDLMSVENNRCRLRIPFIESRLVHQSGNQNSKSLSINYVKNLKCASSIQTIHRTCWLDPCDVEELLSARVNRESRIKLVDFSQKDIKYRIEHNRLWKFLTLIYYTYHFINCTGDHQESNNQPNKVNHPTLWWCPWPRKEILTQNTIMVSIFQSESSISSQER